MSHDEALSAGPSRPLEWTDATIAACPDQPCAVRVFGRRHGRDDAALVLHLHGGAFVSGSLDGAVSVAALLVSAGAVVVSVAYPLAPGHPFPAPVEAAYAALGWAHRSRGRLAGRHARLFVAGEEAGGNLAAALALMARDRRHPPLAGQILLSPMLDACMGTASLRACEAGPVGCKWADGWCRYLDKPSSAEHPYAMPARAMRLAELPPALVVTSEDDPMRDEARAYAKRLREAGVTVCAPELPAPTGWPDAWSDAARAAPPWRAAVRAHLAAFFTESTRC